VRWSWYYPSGWKPQELGLIDHRAGCVDRWLQPIVGRRGCYVCVLPNTEHRRQEIRCQIFFDVELHPIVRTDGQLSSSWVLGTVYLTCLGTGPSFFGANGFPVNDSNCSGRGGCQVITVTVQTVSLARGRVSYTNHRHPEGAPPEALFMCR
jgi:hypothetical protein